MSNESDPPSVPVYVLPPHFKPLSTPPLLSHGLGDKAELWLIRFQDSHVRPDQLTEKRVMLALTPKDGRMGCFENSKGSQFEFLDLHDVTGGHPFAFLPKGNSSLEVRKVSRQVAVVRSLDQVALCRHGDQHASSDADGCTPIQAMRKESHGGSASLSVGVGGLSAVESLQDNEVRSTTGKVLKPGKKSKRAGSNLQPDLSPVGHSDKDLDVHEHTSSSKKKSRKHKRPRCE